MEEKYCIVMKYGQADNFKEVGGHSVDRRFTAATDLMIRWPRGEGLGIFRNPHGPANYGIGLDFHKYAANPKKGLG